MNKVNLYNKAFNLSGECSISIIIDNKKNYEDKIDFLNKANEQLDIPISDINDLKEITKGEFENYIIWKWINNDIVEIELNIYDKYFVVIDNIPEDGIALLAESDDILFLIRFFDAA